MSDLALEDIPMMIAEMNERALTSCIIAGVCFVITLIGIFLPLHPVITITFYVGTIFFSCLTIYYWYKLRVLAKKAEAAGIEY